MNIGKVVIYIELVMEPGWIFWNHYLISIKDDRYSSYEAYYNTIF